MKKIWESHKSWFGGGVFLLALFVAGYFLSKPSYPKESLRIGIVDFMRISTESKAFQDINSYWENKHSEAGRMIFNSDNELRQEYNEIREKEKRLRKPDPALITKKQAFEKKVVALEQLVQQRKNELNTQRMELNTRLNKRIKEILEDISKKDGLHVILNKNISEDAPIVLFSGQSLDITDKVIRKLDEVRDEFVLPD